VSLSPAVRRFLRLPDFNVQQVFCPGCDALPAGLRPVAAQMAATERLLIGVKCGPYWIVSERSKGNARLSVMRTGGVICEAGHYTHIEDGTMIYCGSITEYDISQASHHVKQAREKLKQISLKTPPAG